jgi:hypothetical protein
MNAEPSVPHEPPAPPPALPPSLARLLSSNWYGASSSAGSGDDGSSSAEQAAAVLPDRPQGSTGWLSWLFGSSSGSGGNGGGTRASAAGERRAARRQPGKAAAVQRSRITSADGVPARLPRPASAPKLPAPPGSSQQPLAPKPAPAGDGAAAAQAAAATADGKRASTSALPGKPARPQEGGQKAANNRAAKQANYAERRAAWRQRWVLWRCVLPGLSAFPAGWAALST